MKRVLVVGGVAGGASAAARIRRLDESANITVFERGPHVSFSNCALPYHLSGVIARSEQLVLMSPEKFKKQYNIDVRTENEVTAIDRAAKTVTVKKLADGTEYTESYDVLVLSPGASPIVPRSIGGTDQAHVFTVRNVVDIAALKSYIDTNNVEDVAVIGGGFIGLEVAENLVEAGKKVSLVEAADQVMAPFDYDMVQILHKEMMDHGIDLVVGDGLKEIQADKVVLNSGKELKAGAVVLAIGVAPETALAKAAGLEIGVTGGIKVNRLVLAGKMMRTRLRQQQHPNAVIRIKLDGVIQENEALHSVMIFIVTYLMFILAGTVFGTMLGVDLTTSFSGAVASMGNVGPGFGEVGSMDNFSAMPAAFKVSNSLLMLLGRLEIFGLIQIFFIKWWR